ncbi:MAG: hypothetical protein Q9224_003608 [Gallowayella concinna]
MPSATTTAYECGNISAEPPKRYLPYRQCPDGSPDFRALAGLQRLNATRVGAVSSTVPSSASVAATVGSTAPETERKMPRPCAVQGSTGTNVHSVVAGIPTSSALSLLDPPPADAKPGSKHAPWMRLTEWETAMLRKQGRKGANWSPSEAVTRHMLAAAGRGRENYRIAKAKSEATGEPFVDDDNLGEPTQDSAGSASIRRTHVPVSPDAVADHHHASNGKARKDPHDFIGKNINTEIATAIVEKSLLQDCLVQAEKKLQMMKDRYEGKDQGKRVGTEETQGSPKNGNGMQCQAAEEDWIMVEDLESFVIVENETTR